LSFAAALAWAACVALLAQSARTDHRVAARAPGGAFDSSNPKCFRAGFDPGDRLHPNDAGYQAMADNVNLSIFTRKQRRGK